MCMCGVCACVWVESSTWARWPDHRHERSVHRPGPRPLCVCPSLTYPFIHLQPFTWSYIISNPEWLYKVSICLYLLVGSLPVWLIQAIPKLVRSLFRLRVNCSGPRVGLRFLTFRGGEVDPDGDRSVIDRVVEAECGWDAAAPHDAISQPNPSQRYY